MITFGLNYDVKEEYVDTFIETTKKTLEAMKTVPGHITTHIYRDLENPRSFLIYSEWETKKDFGAFMASEAFRSVQTMGKEMLEKRPSHSIYEKTDMHQK